MAPADGPCIRSTRIGLRVWELPTRPKAIAESRDSCFAGAEQESRDSAIAFGRVGNSQTRSPILVERIHGPSAGAIVGNEGNQRRLRLRLALRGQVGAVGQPLRNRNRSGRLLAVGFVHRRLQRIAQAGGDGYVSRDAPAILRVNLAFVIDKVA